MEARDDFEELLFCYYVTLGAGGNTIRAINHSVDAYRKLVDFVRRHPEYAAKLPSIEPLDPESAY